MKLFIDTSHQDTAVVAIEHGGKRYEKTSESRVMRAQMVLPLIESLLQENSFTIHDITEISIHEGPGSYTGLRVGMSVANALAFFLGVKVNGQPPPLSPTYE